VGFKSESRLYFKEDPRLELYDQLTCGSYLVRTKRKQRSCVDMAGNWFTSDV
jgi:hypothetical protein